MKDNSRESIPVRLPNPTAESFVASLKVVHFYAIFFFWIVLVALVLHVAASVAFQVGLFDKALGLGKAQKHAAARQAAPAAQPSDASPPTSAAPAKGEAAAPASPETVVQAEPAPTPDEEGAWWTLARAKGLLGYIRPLMATMRQVGLLASFLLLVTLFVYLEISLLGRLAGVRFLTTAFFLMLFLVATVYSWEPLLPGTPILGSLYVLDDFLSSYTFLKQHPGTRTFSDWTLHYSRFLLVPILSFALLVISWLKFRRGYVESVVKNE
jgi:hypothetical protein